MPLHSAYLPAPPCMPALPQPAGSKENRVPAAEIGAVLAAGAAAVGFGLLRRLHCRSCDLARQLSETRSELESKSSQLSELMDELETTR